MKRTFFLSCAAALILLLDIPASAQDSAGGNGSEKCDEPIFRPSEVSRKAKIVSRAEPAFTAEALAHNVSGRVVVNAVLCRTGRVTDIQVVNGLPYGMTENVVSTLRQLKFLPAEKDGRIVSQQIKYVFGFNESCGRPEGQPAGRLVESVEVVGARRSRTEAILDHVRSRPGEVYGEAQVQKDLQAIIGLGYFDKLTTHVTVESGVRGGGCVIFEVKELPVIGRLHFEGLKSLQEQEVRETLRQNQIPLCEGEAYDPINARKAVGLIREMLASRGQLNSQVTIGTDQLDATSIVLTLVVDEER